MSRLYPETEPFAQGMLDVGDGHRVYWESCGNPLGKPALVLHGGPGSVAGPSWRRFFDPAVYRVVLFDQRGCGRSTPDARATCAPTCRPTPRRICWLTSKSCACICRSTDGCCSAAPGAARSASATPNDTPTGSPRSCCSASSPAPLPSTGGSPATSNGSSPSSGNGSATRYRRPNATATCPPPTPGYWPIPMTPSGTGPRAWCAWEDTLVSTRPTADPTPGTKTPAFRMTFTRLVTHYWAHDGWFADGQLMAGAHRLAGIPGVLVHGRLNLGSPADVPWRLTKARPEARLELIDEAGHGTGRGVGDVIIDALDRFAASYRVPMVDNTEP